MGFGELLILFLIGGGIFGTAYHYLGKSRKKKIEKPQDNYILGLKAQLEGLDDDAYHYFHQTVAEDTSNVDAYLRLGNLLRKRNALDRAYQVHRELSMRSNLTQSEFMDVRRAMVEDLFAAKRFAEAGKILRELLAKDNKNMKLLDKLLEVYTRTGDWVNAIPTSERLSKLDADLYDRRFLSLYKILEGKAYAAKNDNHRARIAYKEALNYDENSPLAFLYLGDAYVADNRLEEAVEWWRKLCEKMPQKCYICFQRLESALFEIGKFGVIAEIYLQILEYDSQNTRAMRALAQIQTKMGKIPEAINNLRRALQIKPSDAIAALELFQVYKQNNYIQEMVAVAENFCTRPAQNHEAFKCDDCGHLSPEPEILCPSCQKIGTYNI
ncbi:MAG: hypothetical protein CO189_07485 [candidate division Zixibacteria bacterium CG_4_9_14_3_um_filter_46_8]|nr:MAG: hypothetical protein CO189_07485 [candidate division Zixibacteria bacterium CG_4_9_14_3_um_filter_46_8]